MEERDFFTEQNEQRTHTLTCPHCGKAEEYQLAWLVRRKRNALPRHADERDRARFAKAQSYMVRKDDMVACKNIRCRKRFDVAGVQSVAFLESSSPNGGIFALSMLRRGTTRSGLPLRFTIASVTLNLHTTRERTLRTA